MGFFSGLSKSLFADPNVDLSEQTQDLEATVEQDKKMLDVALDLKSVPSDPLGQILSKSAVATPTHARRGQSALSPFASKLLEKAKIESLKSDEEREKLTSINQVFATGEAMEKVEHIESIALERTKRATDKFLHGSRTIPNTNFLQKNGLVRK